MKAAEETWHIERDERGVTWVRGANVKVIEIVREHLAYGWGADELHEQHPALSLGQIHAALAYFYDHQEEFNEQVKALDAERARLRSLTGESTLQRRLRSIDSKL